VQNLVEVKKGGVVKNKTPPLTKVRMMKGKRAFLKQEAYHV
jgi:hypothetical protein